MPELPATTTPVRFDSLARGVHFTVVGEQGWSDVRTYRKLGDYAPCSAESRCLTFTFRPSCPVLPAVLVETAEVPS